MKTIYHLITVLLCITVLPVQAVPEKNAGNVDKPGSSQFVTIDLPFDLFASLMSYAELTELEIQGGENVNAEFIPLLKTVMQEFEKEKKQLQSMPENPGIKRRIKKIDKHLTDFYQELMYRQKAQELKNLLDKQQKMMSVE